MILMMGSVGSVGFAGSVGCVGFDMYFRTELLVNYYRIIFI